MHGVIVEPGYANTMIPADMGRTLPELVRTILYNFDHFDKYAMENEHVKVGRHTHDLQHLKTYRQKFNDGLAEIAARQGWSMERCASVAALKKSHPPDRLYRLKGGYRSATHGAAALVIVLTYRPGQRGGPPEAGVAVLGFENGRPGSATHPLGVPAEGLEDVTELARAGRLP